MKSHSLYNLWFETKNIIFDDPMQAYQWMKKANSIGEHLLAIEIAEFTLNNVENLTETISVKIRQQFALACARTGLIEKAKLILEEIKNYANDGEFYGLFGRIFKDLANREKDLQSKNILYLESRNSYLKGLDIFNDYYCGINASALTTILGEIDFSKEIALRTKKLIPVGEDYWSYATNAEVALILGNIEEAKQFYFKANHLAVFEKRWADIASTRKQCRLLCSSLHKNQKLLDDCFSIGRIGFFSGHTIDPDSSEKIIFPTNANPSVEVRIKRWLSDFDIQIVYSSARAGSEIIFLESALALGIEINMVLPFRVELFIEKCLMNRGSNWIERFHQIYQYANSIIVLNEDSSDFLISSYEFCNRILAAKASSRAKSIDTEMRALVLWDGNPSDEENDIAEAVKYWAKSRIQIQVIHPTNEMLDSKYEDGDPLQEKPFPQIYRVTTEGIRTVVTSLLSIKFHRYQSLKENEYTFFFKELLGGISIYFAEKGMFPAKYGLGGNYLFVWENAKEAGIAALAISSLIRKVIKEHQIDIDFTICLHLAPLQNIINSVLNQYSFEGPGIARLNEIMNYLSEGQVFASETFSEISILEKTREYTCEYIGTVGISKLFSGYKIYSVS